MRAASLLPRSPRAVLPSLLQLRGAISSVCPPAAGVPDMTRGALKWVNESYPGAFFADKGVKCAL